MTTINIENYSIDRTSLGGYAEFIHVIGCIVGALHIAKILSSSKPYNAAMSEQYDNNVINTLVNSTTNHSMPSLEFSLSTLIIAAISCVAVPPAIASGISYELTGYGIPELVGMKVINDKVYSEELMGVYIVITQELDVM
jgi:hypothetical protein